MLFHFFFGEHKFRVKLHGNLRPGDKSHFDGAGHKKTSTILYKVNTQIYERINQCKQLKIKKKNYHIAHFAFETEPARLKTNKVKGQ